MPYQLMPHKIEEIFQLCVKEFEMKEEILKLRQEGKSYNEIKGILGCSLGTIAFHCGKGQKEKYYNRNKAWRDENPLKMKFRKMDYRSKTAIRKKVGDFKRRTKFGEKRLVDSDICSYKELEELFEKNPNCYLTGEPLEINNPSSYHLDHFIPMAKGGSNNIENLRFCTKEANQAKNDLLFDEFLELCRKVLIHNGFDVIPPS